MTPFTVPRYALTQQYPYLFLLSLPKLLCLLLWLVKFSDTGTPPGLSPRKLLVLISDDPNCCAPLGSPLTSSIKSTIPVGFCLTSLTLCNCSCVLAPVFSVFGIRQLRPIPCCLEPVTLSLKPALRWLAPVALSPALSASLCKHPPFVLLSQFYQVICHPGLVLCHHRY